MRLPPGWCGASSGSLTAAAVMTTHLAGQFARARRANTGGPGKRVEGILLSLWFVLGIGALLVRLTFHHDRDAAAAVNAQTGFGLTTGAGNTEVAVAALLLLIYLVGGAIAWSLGYRMHNPGRRAYRSLLRRRKGLERVIRRQDRRRQRLLEGRWPRVGRRVGAASLQEEAKTQEARFAAERAGLEAGADQLRQAVRSHIHAALATSKRDAARIADDEATESARRLAQEQLSQSMATVAAGRRLDDQIDDALRHRRDALSTLTAERAVNDENAWDLQHANALGELAAQEDQLREHAKHQLAAALRDPAGTSGVFFGSEQP